VVLTIRFQPHRHAAERRNCQADNQLEVAQGGAPSARNRENGSARPEQSGRGPGGQGGILADVPRTSSGLGQCVQNQTIAGRSVLSGLFLVAASGWVIRPELLRALRGEQSDDIALIESVLAVIRQHYADSLGERDLRLRAVEGILRNLPDNYSALLADGELKGYRELLEGTSGDVGLRLLDGPLGLSVGEVMPGSPAALRGIRPGDRILTIEDAPTLSWSAG
jgi:hypothetical protein